MDHWFTDAEVGKAHVSIDVWFLSASVVPGGAKGCAVDQHKVARLPVGNIDRRDSRCAGARIIRDDEAFHDVKAVSLSSRRCTQLSAPIG
jgi:hypothetical protein